MSERRKRRLIEWGKNLLIVFLSISCLYLLGSTQFYVDGAATGQNWFASVLRVLHGGNGVQPTQPVGTWSQGTGVRPVRMVITAPQGRTGVQYDGETLDRLFGELTNILADALVECGPPSRSSETRFRTLLGGEMPGIYLDFLGEVPLANLSAWLSGGRTPNENLTQSARRMFLAATEGGEVVLYYINEESGLYYACKTDPDLAGRLEQFVSDISPNGATFAFEAGEQYQSLAPYTLLEGGGTPRPGTYAAANPVPILLTDTGSGYGEAFDALVRSLTFQPQSMSYFYRDAVVLQEGGEKLRIFDSGVVSYEATNLDDPRFPIPGGGEALSQWEIVGSAWTLVEQSLLPLCGEAKLYVSAIEGADTGTTVYFGYQLDGMPVLVGADGYAAKVEFSHGVITGFRLQLRTYSYLDEGPKVLPELQATAAMEALDGVGCELMLYYPDSRGDTVAAAWGAF